MPYPKPHPLPRLVSHLPQSASSWLLQKPDRRKLEPTVRLIAEACSTLDISLAKAFLSDRDWPSLVQGSSSPKNRNITPRLKGICLSDDYLFKGVFDDLFGTFSHPQCKLSIFQTSLQLFCFTRKINSDMFSVVGSTSDFTDQLRRTSLRLKNIEYT